MAQCAAVIKPTPEAYAARRGQRAHARTPATAHIFTRTLVYCKHCFTLTGTPTFSLGSEQFPAAFNCTSSVPVPQTQTPTAYLGNNPCFFFCFFYVSLKAPCGRFSCHHVSQLVYPLLSVYIVPEWRGQSLVCLHHVLSVSGSGATPRDPIIPDESFSAASHHTDAEAKRVLKCTEHMRPPSTPTQSRRSADVLAAPRRPAAAPWQECLLSKRRSRFMDFCRLGVWERVQ